MPRSKSSKKWLQEHFNDRFVQQAKKEGFRSRAVYKLLEIQEKDRILKPGMSVVDLGAAPGGWSQIAVKIVGSAGNVYALDILAMDPLPDVVFIQGDFREQEVLERLIALTGGSKIDLVISDMAPNISGIKDVDQVCAIYLAELALDAATRLLKANGGLIVKVFQGEGFDTLLEAVRARFQSVKIRKPEASRARSQEVYFVAQGFKVG